jgi:ankyrin repeat protein
MPTSFETAIKENNDDLVCNWLTGNRPIPINIRNKASLTGLMIACQSKADATLEEILEINQDSAKPSDKTADLNAKDCMCSSALHYAAKSGSLECIKLRQIASNCVKLRQIASNCVKLRQIASNCVKLHQIASNCSLKTVQKLIEKMSNMKLPCTLLLNRDTLIA